MLKKIINRPIGVLMTTLASLVVSVIFVRNIPISLLPDVPIPQVSLQVNAPQIDARTLENTVVTLLRQQMIQLNDLRDINTQTRNGSALIDLSLRYGANTDLISVEINEKIDQIIHLLPREVDRPRIVKSSLSAIPVFSLNVYIRDSSRYNHLMLSEFVERNIKKRLEQIEEIAFADIHGVVTPEVVIVPRAQTLAALGVDENLLSRGIAQANIEIGNIVIKDGAYEYNVQLTGRLNTIDQIKAIIIPIGDNYYTLGDLAEVQLSQEQRRGAYYFNKYQAVTVAVRKKASANNFRLRHNTDRLLADLRQTYPELGFELSNDQSALLTASIQSLGSSLLYGLSAAVLIMFLFFKNWRIPALIALTLPIGLTLTLFCFYLLGISINVISLAGLVLGIGLMIDNAIIIVENISQRLESGDTDAAFTGPQEVIRPLISSAMTTGSVFLPLILLSGLAGALFYDQAMSISLALINSLLVSYFILPVLAQIILLKSHKKNHLARHRHDEVLSLVLRNKYPVLLIIAILSAASYLLVAKIEKRAMPDISRTAYEIQIDWNESIPLSVSEGRLMGLLNSLPQPIILSCAYMGELQFLINQYQQNINEIKWHLFSDTPMEIDNFLSITEEIKDKFPLSKFEIRALPNAIDQVFDQSPYNLTAHVQAVQGQYAPPRERMEMLWSEIEKQGHIAQQPPMDSYIRLSINRENIAIYGLDINVVLSKIKTALRANIASQLRDTDRFINIVFTQDVNDVDIRYKLDNTLIANPSGNLLSLGQFVHIERLEDYKYIYAIRNGEAVNINFDYGNEKTITDIKNIMSGFTDLSVSFSGQLFENKKMIKELMLIVLVVIALLYLILAAQFESFVQPLIVAVILPIGIGGALLTLFMFGQSLNIISMVGLIILLGIDVNDSILKIDMINRFRTLGYNMDEAILLGSHKRFRAIVMTSLTTILAVTPILWSGGLGAEIQLPMALALVGGLIVGTFSSIFFIPVLYKVFVR